MQEFHSERTDQTLAVRAIRMTLCLDDRQSLSHTIRLLEDQRQELSKVFPPYQPFVPTIR